MAPEKSPVKSPAKQGDIPPGAQSLGAEVLANIVQDAISKALDPVNTEIAALKKKLVKAKIPEWVRHTST